MIKSTFNNIRISALATAVSSHWIPVEEFISEQDEKNILKFKKNTGVEGRYDAASKQTTSDFCFAAAKKVLQYSQVDSNDIGILVFVTQTSDYRVPATACVLQHRLNLSEDCIAFDVNQGCAGMIYAMNIGACMLESSNVKKALVLFGDTSGKNHRRSIARSYIPKDDNEAKLFGDAGVAMLLEKEDDAPKLDISIRTDGSGYKAIIEPRGYSRHYNGPRYSEMNGIDVFNFAIEKPPILIKELMDDIGTVPSDYDCLVLHQANKFIMKQVARRSGFKSDQNLISIDKFGNTSSASIATALTKYYGEENDGAIKAMLCGFGVGLSWGVVSMTMDKKDILPLINTDEYFDDGFEDEEEDILE